MWNYLPILAPLEVQWSSSVDCWSQHPTWKKSRRKLPQDVLHGTNNLALVTDETCTHPAKSLRWQRRRCREVVARAWFGEVKASKIVGLTFFTPDLGRQPFQWLGVWESEVVTSSQNLRRPAKMKEAAKVCQNMFYDSLRVSCSPPQDAKFAKQNMAFLLHCWHFHSLSPPSSSGLFGHRKRHQGVRPQSDDRGHVPLLRDDGTTSDVIASTQNSAGLLLTLEDGKKNLGQTEVLFNSTIFWLNHESIFNQKKEWYLSSPWSSRTTRSACPS